MKKVLTLIFLLLTMSATKPQAQEKITLLLDWFVNPDHAPILIAQELGYFKEMGLEVRLIAPTDPNDPPKLIAAGQADIAISYQPNLYLLVSNGLPIARIGTLIDTPLNSLIVLADGPVKNLKDLKGKRVGYSVSGFEDIYLGAMLAKHGLKLTDISLVNVNFSLSTALATKQVDAVIGAFRNFELNQLAIMGIKARAFYPENEGIPLYDELIFISHQRHIHDQRFIKFLKAIQKSVTFIINNPEESWNIARRAFPEMDDELNQRAWFDTISRFSHNPIILDKQRYKEFAEFIQKSIPHLRLPEMSIYVPKLVE